MVTVPAVQPTARSTLVSLVEENLTLLVREAVCVQRHCKRARIHVPADSDKEHEGVVRRRLHAEDINMALQWKGSEKIYATGTIGASSSDDKKVNLEDYLKSEMDMRPPQEVGLTLHWLSVNGVQPDIPENPAQKDKRVHRVEQEEESLETEGVGGVKVTQLLPRLFSEELQLYFTRITTAVERGGTSPTTRHQLDAALARVSQDSGLQELATLFVHYVGSNLFNHLGDVDRCRTLVRLAHSLLINPHLHLEIYLQDLLPQLLTCVVAERLSSRPWENHWILRTEAALTLVQACDKFGDDYVTLKSKVLAELCKAIGVGMPLSTQYGGIVGISLFGPKAINAFLLPVALEYWGQWEKKLEETNDLEQRLELQMCEQAVLNSLGVFLSHETTEAPDALRTKWDELEDIFGDRMVMQTSEKTEYAMCAI